MDLLKIIRKYLWKIGCDVIRFAPDAHPVARRKQLLVSLGIDTVLDVGANRGQFARHLRQDLGYAGRILSFEPLSTAFAVLSKRAQHDPNWEVFDFALGDVEGRREINVAGNSDSSSLLDMLPAHLDAAPESAYQGREIVEVKQLDPLFSTLCHDAARIYLKIDTQGFEERVLVGARQSLARIDTVQVEMSLVPLYRGQPLFYDLYRLLADSGYSLIAVDPCFADRNSGQVLQVDGTFHRRGDDRGRLPPP
mgnify:CR=1 FL=1